MCAELTAAEQARIVVPIVFRNEYQTALRNLSRGGRCDLYVRTLAYTWRWTAGMPWQDRAAVDGYLVATNAMTDSADAERSGVRLAWSFRDRRPRRRLDPLGRHQSCRGRVDVVVAPPPPPPAKWRDSQISEG